MRRSEIRWYTFAQPDKRRPVLLLTRDAVIDTLNEIIVVPATRTIRGIATEVTLPAARWSEVERALLIACGFEPRAA